MKSFRSATLFIAAVVSALLRGADEAPAAITAAPAKIVAAKATGLVTATLRGVTQPVKTGDTLPVKATLKTGGDDASVMLSFPNGAAINLGATSELAIEVFSHEPGADAGGAIGPSPSHTVLRLVRGELAAQFKPQGGEGRSSFNVATDAGVVWAQNGGATFLITTTTTEVIVTVTEGEIRLRPPGREPIVVAAGTTMRAAMLGAELMTK